MPDVKAKIAKMMTAYDRYVKGKTTSEGVSENRNTENAIRKSTVKGTGS